MKMHSMKLGNWRRSLGRLVGASVLVLLGMSAFGQALPKSPVGTWDCVMSGSRQGAAVMSFFADGTFDYSEIVVPKPPHIPNPNDNPRGGGDTGRTPGTNSTTTVSTSTNLFGWESLNGQWGFDSRGRVLGFFYEITTPTYATNALSPSSTNVDDNLYVMPVTNATAPDEFCVTQTVGTNGVDAFTNLTTCYLITANASTNQLSFVGTVVPNKRLTLLVASPVGKFTFSGVPDAPQPDLSGNWYGVERDSSLWYTEFFTLTPVLGSSNLYDVDGSGPGYVFSGMAIVTPQKQIAIATGSVPLFGADASPQQVLLRSAVGPFNPKRFKGTLHGLRDPMTGGSSHINYSVQHQ